MGFLDSEAQSAVDLIAWRLGDNDKTWSERVQSALLWGISYSEVLSDMCLLPCGDAWRVDGSDEEIFEAIVDDPDELPDDVRRMVLRLVRIPFEPLIAVENRIEKGGEHTEINHAALEQRLDGNCSNDLRTYWRN